MKKKNILLLSALAVFVAISGSIFAYFTARDDRTNVINVGYDEIAINENGDADSNIDAYDPEADKINEENKEAEYPKPVIIDNTGTVPCYIRARIDFSSSEIRKNTQFSVDAKKKYLPVDNDAQRTAYAESTTGWVYNATDGYYYYTNIVEPKGSTKYLLQWVKTDYQNLSQMQEYDIIVYAESVQAVNSETGENYATYSDAWSTFLGVS